MSVRSPISNLKEGPLALSRAASNHLCRVLRLGVGDSFVAFDPENGVEADATIASVTSEAATVSIGQVRPGAVVAQSELALIYGLAKGDKVDAVVRDATELGATRIILARSSRSVAKADGEKASAKIDRWRRIAEQAARQSGRADMPRIEGVLDWKDALAAAGDLDARFCLWENATAPLAPLLMEALAGRSGVAFAIGPEGGLSSDEVHEAVALGYATVSLGKFILRTETAPAAVLGAVRILSQLSS